MPGVRCLVKMNVLNRKGQLIFTCVGELREADLEKLYGASLKDADIEGAKFFRAAYDSLTVFPAHFDPKAHEMILNDGEWLPS